MNKKQLLVFGLYFPIMALLFCADLLAEAEGKARVIYPIALIATGIITSATVFLIIKFRNGKKNSN
jgi:hypothetical protein